MLARNTFILLSVVGGTTCAIAGTPQPFRWLAAGGSLLLLSYVYAQLTKR
jgi:hypothetical protein